MCTVGGRIGWIVTRSGTARRPGIPGTTTPVIEREAPPPQEVRTFSVMSTSEGNQETCYGDLSGIETEDDMDYDKAVDTFDQPNYWEDTSDATISLNAALRNKDMQREDITPLDKPKQEHDLRTCTTSQTHPRYSRLRERSRGSQRSKRYKHVRNMITRHMTQTLSLSNLHYHRPNQLHLHHRVGPHQANHLSHVHQRLHSRPHSALP